MSTVDYTLCAEDHASLLVLVKQVGSHLPAKSFNRLFERISKQTCVAIPNQHRSLELRYDRNYTVENNEWGDFQAHRKVLGLVCFAKCDNENEIPELRKLYEELKQQYNGTVFDSRLVLFGLPPPPSQASETHSCDLSGASSSNESSCTSITSEDKENSNVPNRKVSSPTTTTTTPARSLNKKPSTPVSTRSLPNLANGSKTSNDSSSKDVLLYLDADQCPDLDIKMTDFAVSLFWVLESKRLDRSQEFLDRMPLLMAPFEKRDVVGLDTDSRLYRKRCQGRLRKHLADLCLLSSQLDEALLHYHTSVSTLRAANDWMWLAGALEGLCSVSVVIAAAKKPSAANSGFARNQSFSVKRGSNAVKEAKSKPGALGALAGAGGGGQNGLDLDSHPKSLPDDVLHWYREAVSHYAKFKNASVVEMECSIKACRVLTQMQKWLDASEFLQNVVYISLPLSEEEKVSRYCTLSNLYAEVGMHRKAAFFKRIAAMQCVAPTCPKPEWLQCYQLLLQALGGYRLSLDPKENPIDVENGWPVVQLRVMHELIYSARRMNNPSIAVRHLMFLMHTLFRHLSTEERKEMASVLESYSGRCEATTQAITLDYGPILPPVPFLLFPTVRSFKLVNPAPHLRPVKLKKPGSVMEDSGDNPFIYSPIVFSDKKQKDSSIMDFKWVEGDDCEVELLVHNPLPFELKVSNMALMTEGTAFESYPTSLTLPAESGLLPVKLSGLAKERGDLTILGYQTLVLGCRSNCRLRDLSSIPDNQYTLQVVPPLPCLSVSTSLPTASSFSSLQDSDSVVTSAATCVYAGQSCECQITLSNTSGVAIEVIEVDVDSKLNQDFLQQVLVWNRENLQSQLPLAPGAQASFTVYINGISTFLAPDKIHLPEGSGGMSRSGSAASGGQWASAVAEVTSTDPSGAVVVDALLRLQYSGGVGLREKFCRHCCIAMNVEIQPAVLINRWDVIPSNSVQQCNVVLDLENASCEELELQYTSEDSITLPPKHCQRVALQLAKCNPHLEPRPPAGMIDSTSSSHSSDKSRPPADEQWVDPVRELLTEHVANFVDIRWKIASNNTAGKMSLESIEWSATQMEHLTTSPIYWSVNVNGTHHEEGGGDIKVIEGQPVSIRCSLTNTAACYTVRRGEVSLQCYQDKGAGEQTDATSLHSQLACLGANRLTIKELMPGNRVKHSCSFVFFCPGRYVMDLCASGALDPVPLSSPTSPTSLQSPQSPSKSLQSPSKYAKPSISQPPTTSSTGLEKWRYIPRLVIRVQSVKPL